MKELNELVEANIISVEKAEEIKHYLSQKKNKPDNRLILVFGILGALLVGLGIILIVAHNWDSLSNATKLIFAFLPLAVGQLLCWLVISKKSDSAVWREAGSAFLFLAIATSISIVSQVYNLHGNLGRFLLVWMLLSLPIMYATGSSIASLLYWVGITWYASEVSYFENPQSTAYLYWGLLIAALPQYWGLVKNSASSNFTAFHHWFVAMSLTISLGMFGTDSHQLMILCYISLFSIFIIIAQSDFLLHEKTLANAYLIVGSMGMIVLQLVLTFRSFWDWFSNSTSDWSRSPELAVLIVLMMVAVALLFYLLKVKQWHQLNFQSYAFLLFVLIAFAGSQLPALAQVIANIVVLVLAIFTIRDGANKRSLRILNYGLLIIAALIACRFFDTNLSFALRGLIFVGVGLAFFAANFWLIGKKKQNS